MHDGGKLISLVCVLTASLVKYKDSTNLISFCYPDNFRKVMATRKEYHGEKGESYLNQSLSF